MADIRTRVENLELAVLALGAEAEEFGDSEGHPFHGNQWSSGGGSGRSATVQSREDREKNRDPLKYKGAKPEPKPAVPAALRPSRPSTISPAQLERGVSKLQRDLEVGIKDAVRDNPEYSPDQIARDIAESVALGQHPDVIREFYRREGFEPRPGELRRGQFSTEELGDSAGHAFHGNQYTLIGGVPANEKERAFIDDKMKGGATAAEAKNALYKAYGMDKPLPDDDRTRLQAELKMHPDDRTALQKYGVSESDMADARGLFDKRARDGFSNANALADVSAHVGEQAAKALEDELKRERTRLDEGARQQAKTTGQPAIVGRSRAEIMRDPYGGGS
jgi:hypothetical protein